VSPDGLKVAYFASGNKGGGLWARSLDDLTPARIAGNFDVVSIPSFFWSADSRFVAFSGGNDFHRLMVADSAGGPPETLAEMNVRVAGGSWSRDATILFGSMTPGIWRISAAGGEPVQLTANDPSHPSLGHFSPILLPDAKHFLYFVLFGQSSADSGIFVGSMDTKPVEQNRERIVATNTAATFVSTPDPRTGYLLFIRDDALLAQTLDLSTLQLTGTPTRIASGVGGELEFGGFSASTDGVLAYRITPSRGINLIKPTWFDRKGERTGTLTNLNAIELGGIALSPDGTRAAVSRTDPNRAGQQDIWLLDFARNDALLRLTSGTALHFDPVWSPDGKQIAYVSTSKQAAALAKRPSSGSGTEEVVLQANGKERHLNHWSPDGRFLLFTEQNETTNSDIWVVPVDGERKPEVFLNSEFNETQGQFSPDGHWIAYVSNETGEPQVYIQPFPRGAGSGEKISVSGDVGVMPRWRRDGKELFYVRVRGGNRIMAADFSTTPSAAAGIPHGLFTVPIMGTNAQLFLWDVAPSGDRFFLSALPEIKESDAPLTVVLNWQRMLEK